MLLRLDLLTAASHRLFSTQEEKELTRWEKVEIPTEYKGLVIGKQGASLLEISKETGAKVTRARGEVYITQGTKQQRDQAKLLVKSRVVGSLDKFCLPSISKFCSFSSLSLFFNSNQFCSLRQCRNYFSRYTITRGTIVLFVPVPDIFAHAQAERHTNFSSI